MEERIFTITLPEGPWYPPNVYLLEGEPLTLFDTGPKVPRALEALEVALHERGYRLADIQQVVISHAHQDHCGLAGTIRSRGRATILCSAKAADMVESLPESWHRRAEGLSRLRREYGMPPALLDRLFDDFVASTRYADRVAVDRRLYDGDTVFAGDAEWQVMETPGHFADHICLYQPDAKILLSGDHLAEAPSVPELDPRDENGERSRSLVRYVASLVQIAALEVTSVLPGHGQLLTSHRAVIADRIAFYERQREWVYRLLRQAGALTAFELTDRMFPGQTDDQYFHHLFDGVVGILDLLENQRSIETQVRNGIIHYKANRDRSCGLRPLVEMGPQRRTAV